MTGAFSLLAIASAKTQRTLDNQTLAPLLSALGEAGAIIKKISMCNGQPHELAREIRRAFFDGASHVVIVAGLQPQQRQRTLAGMALAFGVLATSSSDNAPPQGAEILGQPPDQGYLLSELDQAALCLPMSTSAALTLLTHYCQRIYNRA